MSDCKKSFLEVLNGCEVNHIPFWFMRQAGRYLPEYRDLRSRSGGFLDMVYNPAKACEITMQPIRRFGMDAAIIFSDILVIPQALGQKVDFEEGKGPVLNALQDASDISALNFSGFKNVLEPIYEAISNVKTSLVTENYNSTALIGFCGAPWTVASYMIEGGSSKDFLKVKKFSYMDEKAFSELIDLLVESSAQYLINQVNAGAQALQIFDSWAGVLDANGFRKWVINPTRRIVNLVKNSHPNIPVIGFPKAAGNNHLNYVLETGVDAISLDPSVDTSWAQRVLKPHAVLQGNLDPICLLAGGDNMLMSIEEIIGNLKPEGKFIFNLGHGIHKDTPVENVEILVKAIRELGKA